jgi:type IV pilus biogenesis protein CpaD/CtpE
MRRLPPSLAAFLAALLLAGCADQPVGTFDRAAFRVQGLERTSHMMGFLPDTSRLAPGEEERLGAFLAPLAGLGTGEILVTYLPSGSPELDLARVRAVTAALRRTGWPGSILVVETRSRERTDRRSDLVMVEPLGRGQLLVACPRRVADDLEDRYATPLPPLGCANAANLAHMAADRRDLVEPRTLGPSDGAVSAAAVLRHRTGQVTEPPSVGTRR